MSVWIYALTSVLFVSSVSLIGLLLIRLKPATLASFSHLLVSFALGTLLGDAFLHLLPESFDQLKATPSLSPILVMVGIGLFFVVEKFIHFRHCHQPDCSDEDHTRPLVTISLVGDSVHNFLDGLAIAAAFLTSPIVGLATTIAIIIHEIPQEIGDYGIYIHSGLTRRLALWLNFVSSLSAFFGVILALLISSLTQNISIYLLPITAGGFIYLALSDLVPELHHHTRPLTSLLQLATIILGVLIMVGLTFLKS